MGLYFQRPDIPISQDLSLAALSYTTSISRRFKLEEISIHASQSISETVTITRDSKNGTNYDTILVNRAMVSEQDFVYRPVGDNNFQDGDEVKVQCTNANVLGSVYGNIKTSELP